MARVRGSVELELVDVEDDSSPSLVSDNPDASPSLGAPRPSLSDLTPEQHLEWRKTGTLPTLPAESSPATADAAPPASTDAPSEPASEPAPSDYKSKTAKRIGELLESNRTLQRELAALRAPKPDVQPVSSTVAASEDPEPDPETYEDYSKFIKDQSLWAAREVQRRTHADQLKTHAEATAKADVARMQANWDARVTAAAATYADFDQAVVEALIPPKSIIDAYVQEIPAEAASALLYHFQKHPTDVARVVALSPMLQLEELVTLKGKALAGPTVKRKTSAPDPAPTLGTRASGSDPAAVAVKAKDFRAYNDTVNARELAARKGA